MRWRKRPKCRPSCRYAPNRGVVSVKFLLRSIRLMSVESEVVDLQMQLILIQFLNNLTEAQPIVTLPLHPSMMVLCGLCTCSSPQRINGQHTEMTPTGASRCSRLRTNALPNRHVLPPYLRVTSLERFEVESTT